MISANGQTTANQLRELRGAAKRLGHQVVAEFTDEGISGAKGRDGRPGLNSLLEGRRMLFPASANSRDLPIRGKR